MQTATMESPDIAQIIIDKADTIVALGAAAISGGWAYRVKKANAKLTEAQTEQTAVETMIQVAHELRMDFAAVKADLKACHDEKAAMGHKIEAQNKRIDHQNEVIQDITEALSRSMELQGLPMPIKRPHRDDLTGA